MEHPDVIAARAKLNSLRGHWSAVEERAKVSRSWMDKFSRGEITNPTVDTLQRVSDACTVVQASVQAIL